MFNRYSYYLQMDMKRKNNTIAEKSKGMCVAYTTIEYEKREHVGLIHLRDDITERDAIARLSYEISELSSEIVAEDDIWTVVITGIGNNPVRLEMSSMMKHMESEEIKNILLPSASESIAHIEKPIIAGIDGDALGQELELMLACDIRIATKKSSFGSPQLEKGLIPRDGGTQRLARLVGKGNALEMILTGKTIDAQEAYRIGLVHKVVSNDALKKTVMDSAQGMASKGPLALQYAKEAIHTGMDLTLEQGLHLEADLYLLLHTTQDRTEGIRAFQEKKKPQFEGK